MDPQPFSLIDAYRIWLSIPVEECPPNHYRLLGLKLLEDDAKVIQNAADRQMGYLRTKQTGPHSAYSQQLLNEVSLAAGRLLNLETKTAYDAQLSAALSAITPECKAAADSAEQPLKFALDLGTAETVRALKLQTLAPLTIARLECKVTRGGDWTFTNRLHSNGTVNLPHTNSWTIAPGILHLQVSSPTKIYRDRLVLAEDGKSFHGTNNDDNKDLAGHFADQLLPQDIGPDRLSLLR